MADVYHLLEGFWVVVWCGFPRVPRVGPERFYWFGADLRGALDFIDTTPEPYALDALGQWRRWIFQSRDLLWA